MKQRNPITQSEFTNCAMIIQYHMQKVNKHKLYIMNIRWGSLVGGALRRLGQLTVLFERH